MNIKHFTYEHLPANLQEISKPICEVAREMNTILNDGPEKSAGMRKLMEAKDCMVRQKLEDEQKKGETSDNNSIPPHQQRVIDEEKELRDKLEKLTAFFNNPIYTSLDKEEQKRLSRQAQYMDQYLHTLVERIENF